MSEIGRPLARPDAAAKVRGEAVYAADQNVRQQLYAAYVPATIAAGRVLRIDAEAALGRSGVVRVLTADDMPRMTIQQAPPAASTFLPMQTHEVRHQGQPVGLVLAETLEAAEAAAKLVKVSYIQESFLTPDNSPDRRPPRSVPPNKDSGYLGGGEADFSKGEVESEVLNAKHRLEAIYSQPSRHNNPMEPSATLAHWQDDHLTLYDAVQHGYSVQMVVASALSIPVDNVRIVCPHTGGGFGSKGYVWPHQILTAAAARLVGRPVKLVLTRADMYANVGYQPRIVQEVLLSTDVDGHLTALRQVVTNVTSVSDDFVELASQAGRSMYASPAIRTDQLVEPSHINLPTPMRAPVDGPGTWALGAAMDELAALLRLDPLDLRLLNHADVDPKDGRPFSSKKLREAYEVGAARFGWRERGSRERIDGHWRIGFGMADCTMGTFRMASKARVRLRSDGCAVVQAGFHDIGSGAPTVMPQIAADVLGLPLSSVTTASGDTDLPPAGPTYGSSSTLSGGSAVMLAAQDVRGKLALIAGMNADLAVMRDGRICSGVDDESSDFREIMARAGVKEIIGEGSWAPPGGNFEADGGTGPYAMRTFGVVFVEVAVDPDLGLLRLRRAVGAYSAGRIINPRTARAQMTGGIIWGWGMAAMEQSRHETVLGRWEAKNLSNVVIPVNADIPTKIDVTFVDEYDSHASLIGAKGIGELGATGVAAAVANAVFDAIGCRIRALPITAEKLLAN